MLNIALNGGIILDNPHLINTAKVIQAPLPNRVVLPLQQRIGSEAQPCVKVGDRVLTGQIIAQSQDVFCTPIHASISGTIVAIDLQTIPHNSGLKVNAISIESDEQDEWIAHSGYDFLQCTKLELIDIIQQAGIVGLGGGGFPTHTKLQASTDCHSLIINATECEPGIICDDGLMQKYPDEIIRGVEILLKICGAQNAIIAIEDNKQKAFDLLLNSVNNPKISIQQMPTKYTCGTEKLLIKSLLGIEIPSGSYACEMGVLCQNVATTKAVFDAVIEGKPLVSRVVTVTGSGVAQPYNFEVRLGATFEHIVRLSKPNNHPHIWRMGGMMMGVDVADIQVPICKITNCIFVNNITSKPDIQACIRCGQCNEVCPVGLLPQQLYWYAKSENIDKAMDYNLPDCIECACCDYVCPSHIPLAAYFSFAKALSREQILDKNKSDIARKRFEYREYRLERNQQERAKMMAAKKVELKQKMAKDKTQKDKIAAAMARVKKTKADK